MTRDPGSIKSLKKYYNNRTAKIDTTALMKELEGTSDRAAVIVLSALVDDALTTSLSRKMRHLTEEEHQYAFRNDGPLGR